MNVVLIGYRGTGKTSAARHIALRLGWDWVDADVEVELRAGKSIAAIFADDGEPRFRDLESQVLAELSARDHTAIAAGGGAVLREANRLILKSAGRVAWLTATPEVLWRRIEADASTAGRRPNLTSQGGLAEIRRLLAEREPWYRECAAVRIDTDDRSPSEVAEEIIVAFDLTPERKPT